MFWGKKQKSAKDKSKAKPANQKKTEGMDMAEVRAQALANAKMARENIGEDTLNRIAAAMHKKQSSATERAKSKIQTYKSDEIAQELRFIMEEDYRT